MSDFNIIDDQADFVVIDKGENVNFHDELERGQGLFNQVAKFIDAPQLFPVHRLDKMTSGLIIFAKNLATAQQFQKQFEQHEVEKYYLALSQHKPKKKQGWIKGDMEKSRRGMFKLTRAMNNPAITQFFSYSLGDGQRLFLVKPHSGKTHQIRVALNSIGSTILGDPLYANKQDSQDIDRGYLHAYGLKFSLNRQEYQYVLAPKQGVYFTSEVCKKLLSEELTAPWQLAWPKA